MISLIMDAYGTVKDFYEQGGPSSRLNDFINEPTSPDLLADCAKHRRRGSFGSFDAAAYDCQRTWCGCYDWLKKRFSAPVKIMPLTPWMIAVHLGRRISVCRNNVFFALRFFVSIKLTVLLYYPVMLSHFSPAPVKTDQVVRIQ